MKYDCLIVDDEVNLANNTCEYLNMFGVTTYACYTKSECEEFLKDNQVSLILLDINLPDGSGFELCKNLRANTDIPILFISAMPIMIESKIHNLRQMILFYPKWVTVLVSLPELMNL